MSDLAFRYASIWAETRPVISALKYARRNEEMFRGPGGPLLLLEDAVFRREKAEKAKKSIAHRLKRLADLEREVLAECSVGDYFDFESLDVVVMVKPPTKKQKKTGNDRPHLDVRWAR